MDERIAAMTAEREAVTTAPGEKQHREVLAELRRQAQLLETISETSRASYSLFRLLVTVSAGAWLLSVVITLAAYLGVF
jgi:hypothetical protein